MRRSWARCISTSFVPAVVVGVLLAGAPALTAAVRPVLVATNAPYAVRASVRGIQPAVSGLFQLHAPRVWTDAVGEAGAPGANGVPDFLDTWEAFGARTNSAILKNGYAFTTVDGVGHEVLYAGAQRASIGGPGNVVLEFNQVAGKGLPGDLRISAEVDAAGNVGPIRFEALAGAAKAAAKFLPIAILPNEGCNDDGTACVVANGSLLEFGYNLTILGKPEKDFSGIQITAPEDSAVGTFAAATVNPVTLPVVDCPSNLGSCTANDVTTSVKAVAILNNDLCTSLTDTIQLRITTAYAATSNERYDLGLFVSGDGGTVREPSTALVCLGAAAQGGQGNNLAYPDADTDLFLSIDPAGHSTTPGTTDTCGDLRASAGPVDWTVDATVDCKIANNELRIPSCRVWEQNANHKVSCQTLQQAGTGSKCDCTDLVVTAQLNPCATTICNDNNDCTTDSCTVVGTAPNLTAQCVYTNNTNACDDNNACTSNDSCSGGICAGGSSVSCAASDQCHVAGTCNPSTGICSNPVGTGPCNDGSACTTGETCQPDGTCGGGAPLNCSDNNVCTDDTCSPTTGCGHTNNTADCGGAPSGTCDAQDKCEGGTCVPKYAASSTVCRGAGGVCDLAENCTGSSAVCPADLKSTAECRASAGVCDLPESCNGTTNNCPADAFKTNAVECRASAGVCDLAESCTGNSAACPNDAFKGPEVVCRARANSCDADEHCSGSSASCGPDVCLGGQQPISYP